jgi:hypothetical protein
MVTIAMSEDMMSLESIDTEDHSSDEQFGDITVETSHKISVTLVGPYRYIGGVL